MGFIDGFMDGVYKMGGFYKYSEVYKWGLTIPPISYEDIEGLESMQHM